MTTITNNEVQPQAIRFVVVGTAVPAGSKTPWNPRRANGSLVLRPDGRPVIATMDSTKRRGGEWKQAVASAAREAYQGPLLTGPLSASFTFYRTRPKSHFTPKGELTKAGREQIAPTTKPDLLKTARAIEDALSKVIYLDDAQIVLESLCKRWGDYERTEIVICTVKDARS